MRIDKLERDWELQQEQNFEKQKWPQHGESGVTSKDLEDAEKQLQLDDCAHYLVNICGLVLEESSAAISLLSVAWTPDEVLFDKDDSAIYFLNYCIWLNTDHRWEFESMIDGGVSNCYYESIFDGLVTTQKLINQGVA